MLAIIAIAFLLTTAQCLPSDPIVKDELPLVKAEEPKPDEPKLLEKVPEEPQPAGVVPIPEAGAPLPEDIGLSPDANPVAQPDNSDLNTDSTFWGWGYRRPYYGGWRSYYSSPWSRWGGYGGYGYGRGYGGWGRGWGWHGGYW